MTKQEAERFDTLTRLIYEVREDMAGLVQKVDNLCELRTVNGMLTKHHFEQFESRCDERHTDILGRVGTLEQSDKLTFGMRSKIAGMGIPVAVLIAILSVILSVIR